MMQSIMQSPLFYRFRGTGYGLRFFCYAMDLITKEGIFSFPVHCDGLNYSSLSDFAIRILTRNKFPARDPHGLTER